MAAITGLVAFSMASCTSSRLAPFCAPPNSVMSAPAMKVRPSQISTTALAAGSARAWAMPIAIPSRTPADRALTGGELSVRTAMSPSTVRSATALMAVMGVSSKALFSKGRLGGPPLILCAVIGPSEGLGVKPGGWTQKYRRSWR